MKTLHHLLTLAVLLLSHGSLDAAQPGKTQNLTSPDQVPEGLAKSDWSSIRAAYEAGRHAFMPNERGWQARNPGQQWTTQFDGRGFLAKPKEGDWTWGLELRSYGVGEKQTPVGERPPQVKAAGQRLTYDWDATLQEWWVNDQRGLEHGYIVRERPEQKTGRQGAEETGRKASSGPSPSLIVSQSQSLSFTLATRGTLTPKVTADALGVEFRDASGATVLHYAGLKVWDADGKTLPSHFESAGGKEVRLLVDERGARYPLTIDPIAQQAYVKAGNNGPAKSDQFGYSVAVAGDTVVVGARFEDSSTTGVQAGAGTPDEGARYAGAAYVFTVVVPTVTGITPSGGPTTGGTTVTITGPVFDLVSTTTVTLGGVPATGVTVLNGTTITAKTGAHATGLVDVVVTDSGGPGTGTNLFRYASNTLDTDGDGLNDAAELVSSAQGFDWQVAQPALVNSFRSGLGLYTPAQVQALKVGTPLIQRHPTTGVFTLTIGVEKSTTLTPLSFTPFSMLTAPGAATSLNGAGKLQFQFTAPDNAAFFRLQSQ